MESNDPQKIVRTEAEWKKLLTPEQYYVLRQKGTERPFGGKYNTFKEEGVYKCGACGAMLFSSESKFDSHCGWPAFFGPGRPQCGHGKAGYQPWHGPHRNYLPQVRFASGSRF